MAALFGQSGDGRREPKSLVEFRAGKMKLTGSTVTADTRKGLAFMKMEDGLLHFLWKDRKTGEVVDVSGGRGCGSREWMPVLLRLIKPRVSELLRVTLILITLDFKPIFTTEKKNSLVNGLFHFRFQNLWR